MAKSAKVDKILNAVYCKVQTLEEFCLSISNNDVSNVMTQDTDKQSFLKFLRTTLVATPETITRCTSKFCDVNYLTQSDVLVQAIERIKRREGKGNSLLTFGCSDMSSNPSAQVCGSMNFEYVFPNQNISSLMQPHWKLLLSRIGDERMLHLLETRAVFILVTDSCYVQLTGIPIYEMWPFERNARLEITKETSGAPISLKQKMMRIRKGQQQRSKTTMGENETKVKNADTDLVPCNQKRKRKHSSQGSLPIKEEYSESSSSNQSKKRKLSGYHYKSSESSNIDLTVLQYEHDLNAAFCDFNDDYCEVIPNSQGPTVECYDYDEKLNMTSSFISANGDTGNNTLYVTSLEEMESSDSSIKENSLKLETKPDGSESLFGNYTENVKCAYLCDNVDKLEEKRDPICLYTSPSKNMLQSTSKKINFIADSCSASVGVNLNEKHTADLNSSEELLHGLQQKSVKHDVSNTILQEKSTGTFGINEHISGEVSAISKNNVSSQQLEVHKNFVFENLAHNNIVKTSGVNMKEKLQEPKHSIKTVNKCDDFQPYSFHTYFNRTKMLYCKNFKESFVPSHILEKKNESSLSKEAVLDILRIKVSERDDVNKIKTLPLIKSRLVPIMEKMIQNHRNCKYIKTLSFYAPLPKKYSSAIRKGVKRRNTFQPNSELQKDESSSQTKTLINRKETTKRRAINLQKSSKMSLQELLGHHISSRQVFLFIRRLCITVIPENLLGSKQNLTALCSGIRQLFQLGKYEKYCLGQIMTAVKISHCRWLPKKLPHVQKEIMVAKVIYWIIDSFIFSVVKSFLYVTETTLFRNRLFYYRKCIWRRINQKAVADYLKKAMLKEVTETAAKSAVNKGLCLGIASLRLMPKTASVRPIVNMGRKILVGPNKGGSINRQLQNILQILSHQKDKDPSLIGSSQFGATDIYNTWRQFVLKRKERGDGRPLYLVKMDVEKCYDSIDQTKLYRIIAKCLKQHEDEYVVRRHCTTHLATNQIKRIFQRDVTSLDQFEPDFLQYVRKLSHEKKKVDMIFVDQVMHMHETKDNTLDKLKKHLFCNIIQIGKKYYHQVIGIGQGSILSTILCNYYYGDMEKKCITVESDELLMRQVDDFLFATPYLQNARRFLDLMIHGIAEYGCKICHNKTVVNFKVDEGQVVCIPFQALFPWCGILINPVTLEVMTDYTRYSGLKVTDIMTFDITQQMGQTMKLKLQQSLPQKNQWICLDPDINHDDTLTLTLYKLFVMTAYKFHANLRKMCNRKKVAENSPFLMSVILSLPGHLSSQINQKFYRQIKYRECQILCQKSLSYICLNAFYGKLLKHQGLYGWALVTEISKQMKVLELHQTMAEILNRIKQLLQEHQRTDFLLMV